MLRTMAFLCLTTAALAQQTWIVDPNGTGNFTNLGAAIAAASPFDVLILRGGAILWGPFVVNKPLAIIGDNTAGRSMVTELRITSATPLPAPVTISGIEVWRLVAYQPATIEDATILTCEINTTATLHRCVIGAPQLSYNTTAPWRLRAGHLRDSG